ncbi:hypothetical protein B0I00_1899 [Novosphingobium kunmingense]|uniref:Uncharacterized protein n=1 Tax=Novosphingobium kunmingense TaxID=1211806 RepID=A0A2N0HL74_9SPHN|nr:hypothetical protein [Novosphingobium kunmingense]PKB19659.1 hypothetical protein B0I00_1899 [Novosphingobium kunmingense]
MAGRQRAVRAEFEARRDLSLMTAYFSGLLSQIDWKKAKIPDRFDRWRDQMTRPRAAASSSADRVAAFEALAAAGFDIKVTRRLRNPAPGQKP